MTRFYIVLSYRRLFPTGLWFIGSPEDGSTTFSTLLFPEKLANSLVHNSDPEASDVTCEIGKFTLTKEQHQENTTGICCRCYRLQTGSYVSERENNGQSTPAHMSKPLSWERFTWPLNSGGSPGSEWCAWRTSTARQWAFQRWVASGVANIIYLALSLLLFSFSVLQLQLHGGLNRHERL